MQVLTESFGDVLVAHTPDELTDDPAHVFANTLRRTLDSQATESGRTPGRYKIVLQMDRSDAFDSAGLTALLDLHDALREAGGQMKLCGLTATGRKVFEITRLDRRFEVFEGLIEAVSSFRSN